MDLAAQQKKNNNNNKKFAKYSATRRIFKSFFDL